jgi:anti-sigma factor RsiW
VNTHWTERLSEYLDGELSSSERAACDAHLAGCPACRIALEEIQLVTSLARVDEDVMPVHDLWPGIAARIESGNVVTPTFGAPPKGEPSTRRISFTLPQLALAASLLIAVSGGVAYLAAGRAANRPAATEAPIQAMAEPMMPPSADVAPANFADAQFDRAVSDLEQILAEQRDDLDPRTVMVIERNMAVIDEAIRQARAALDADPANQFLNSHLAESRRRKLDLLRRATDIAASSGD